MKILGISLGRKNGTNDCMCKEALMAAKEMGAEVEFIQMLDLDIKHCTGCTACTATAFSGRGNKCVIKDDFQEISETLISADGIVIAAPVYWYTFPAQIKAAIDRFYSIYGGGHTFTGKKVALLSCCEEDTTETFNGIKFAFEKTMAFMDATIVDEILMPGVVDAGDIYKTDGIDKAKELVNKF